MEIDEKLSLESLLDWLKENASGQKNAITVNWLKGFFGWDIQELGIHDFRRFIVDNLPIASTTKGLFYPTSKEDLEAFEHHIKSRIFTMWKRMKRVSEAFPELTKEGQMDLFKFEDLEREVGG